MFKLIIVLVVSISISILTYPGNFNIKCTTSSNTLESEDTIIGNVINDKNTNN